MQSVHSYGYPYKNATITDDWNAGTIQCNITGSFNKFIECCADSAEIGFKVTGSYSTTSNAYILWPSDSLPTNPVIGIDLVGVSTIVEENTINSGGAGVSATGIRVGAAAFRSLVTGNQLKGSFTDTILNSGARDGVPLNNTWDGGKIVDFTCNQASRVDIATRDAASIPFRWRGSNAGQFLMVCSGASGYLRFLMETANAGLQIGASNNYVGFLGSVPVAKQNANDDLETVLSRFGLITAGSVRATRVRLNPRSSNVTITTQAGDVQSVDALAGPVSVTLPTTTTPGYVFVIKKTDGSTNAVTVVGTIDGAANYTLPARWNFVRVVSISTSGSWLIVGKG